MKKKKWNIKDELVGKYKITVPDFEQNWYSRLAKGIFRIGRDSIRKLKSMAYYDKNNENINHTDLMASVLSYLN